jgi:GTPase Era involved in 16S rRNA processing
MEPIMTDAEVSQFDSRLTEMLDKLAQVFRAHGAVAALKHLSSIHPGPADRAKVVVVGAVNAGKTALVNAVLDRPDLLPIRPTTTYFAVGAGQPERVRIHLSDGSVVTDTRRALHDRLDHSIDDAAVEHVEVMLDEPGLEAMTLFDTPGVGGLDDGAAQATLTALEQATALLFVCSAEAKISIADRAFLIDAARRIDHVVLVVSKVDLLDDLGAENLREDEDTLARSDRAEARFANLTFLPFSARIAKSARDNPRKLADSGITALREHLARIAARHAAYSQLNVMRAMKEAITLANSDLHQRRKALGGPAAAAELRRIEERLTDLDRNQTTWRRALQKELDEAIDAVRTKHNKRMKTLRNDFEGRLATRDKEKIADYETDVKQALCQAQTAAIADLNGHVAEIQQRLRQRIFANDPDIADLPQKLRATGENPADHITERTRPAPDIPRWMEALTGTYQPVMMIKNIVESVGAAGGAATIAGLSGAAMGPIIIFAVPIGVAWHLYQKRLRDHSADLASLDKWATRAINDISGLISEDISRGFKEATRLLEDAIEKSITQAIEISQTAQSTQKAAISDLQYEEKHLNALSSELAAPTREWNVLYNELLAFATAPLSTASSPENTAVETGK